MPCNNLILSQFYLLFNYCNNKCTQTFQNVKLFNLIFQDHRQSSSAENESLAKDLQITPDHSEDENLSGRV